MKSRAEKFIPKLLKEDPQAFGYLKGRWVYRDIARELNKEGVYMFCHLCAVSAFQKYSLPYRKEKLDDSPLSIYYTIVLVLINSQLPSDSHLS